MLRAGTGSTRRSALKGRGGGPGSEGDGWVPLGSFLALHSSVPCRPPLPRASSAWFSTIVDCSTQSTSSWRAGGGAGPGTGSWTSVSFLGQGRPKMLQHSEVLLECHPDPYLCWAS